MPKFIRFKENPIFLHVYLIWCISKLYQYTFNREHTVWEVLWQKIIQLFDGNEKNIFAYGTTGILAIGLSLCAGFFSIFDFISKPNLLQKYKTQPNTNEPPETRKYFKGVLVSLFNGFILTPPFLIILHHFRQWRGLQDMYELPSIYRVLFEAFLSELIFEVFFYTTHRIFHHKFLYKHFHKHHHEWVSSQAIASINAHPLEHILTNLLSFSSGTLVLNPHLAIHLVAVLLITLSVCTDHSGYHLPFVKSPEFHDFHHLRFNCNYGGLGFMDSIFGTDHLFKDTIQEKRDRTLWTLKSIHELYPDEKEKETSSDNQTNKTE